MHESHSEVPPGHVLNWGFWIALAVCHVQSVTRSPWERHWPCSHHYKATACCTATAKHFTTSSLFLIKHAAVKPLRIMSVCVCVCLTYNDESCSLKKNTKIFFIEKWLCVVVWSEKETKQAIINGKYNFHEWSSSKGSRWSSRAGNLIIWKVYQVMKFSVLWRVIFTYKWVTNWGPLVFLRVPPWIRLERKVMYVT